MTEIDMVDEMTAWLQVCKELTALGININDQARLAGLLVFWGEALAQLRIAQPEYVREAALEQAKARMARL